jgi:DNA ligase-associated metallophosphoesterase
MTTRSSPTGPDCGGVALSFAPEPVVALPSGALWAPRLRTLAVADLHLGRSERVARLGGALLPPYETAETLDRLAAEVAACDPDTVVCVGDSFDDDRAARALDPSARAALAALADGRRWIWIGGNHDPSAPDDLPGAAAAELSEGGLTFRHIAAPDAAPGEVSAHFHPKATLTLRGRRIARRCFLFDRRRIILPAFGAYTGGLDAADPAFDALLGPEAAAALLGPRVTLAQRAALTPRGACA